MTSSPFSTFHFGSPPPRAACHWDRSFPSNSTTASDGGLAGSFAVSGVTTFGRGRVSSWTGQFLSAAPSPGAAATDAIKTNGTSRPMEFTFMCWVCPYWL